MAEAAAANAVPTPPKGGSVKLLLIILIVLVLAGAGGAAAWFFLGGGSNHGAHTEAAKPKEPVFVPMETLTVNLQPQEGSDRYLQIAITFKSYDKHAEESIKTYTPELRSRVLLLLSSKSPTELYTSEGKAKLAHEIVEQCAQAYKAVGKESPVADVLFTNFVIQ